MDKRINALNKAVAAQDANNEYTEAYNALCSDVSMMDRSRFWATMADFRAVFLSSFSLNGARNAPDHAADEFCRLAVVEKAAQRTLVQTIGFIKRWDNVTKALYAPLFDVIKDRGDDGYGDLLDALPLAGEKFFDAAIAGQLKTGDQARNWLQKCLQENVHNQSNADILFRTIWEGENYFRMRLDGNCKKFYRSQARETLKKIEQAKEQILS